jgi:hypothetical protein
MSIAVKEEKKRKYNFIPRTNGHNPQEHDTASIAKLKKIAGIPYYRFNRR